MTDSTIYRTETSGFENSTDPDECNCPVHGYFASPPPRLPCGISFADRVDVRPIPFDVAGEIYKAHHSYLPSYRTSGAPVHHGIYLSDELVGAITYAYMLCSDPILGVDPDRVMAVARVCIVNRTPNLASAALARSQKKFVDDYGDDENIRLLTSFVVEGLDGSMFAALRGLGWRRGRWRRGKTASNRPDNEVRSGRKRRWFCVVGGRETELAVRNNILLRLFDEWGGEGR